MSLDGRRTGLNSQIYVTYSLLEQLLIKACQGDDLADELDYCCRFAGNLRAYILKPKYVHSGLTLCNIGSRKFDCVWV